MSVALPPSPQSPSATSLLPHLEATTSTTTLPSSFDQTTRNLLRLGSLTMDKFAQDPSEELDGFDIPLVDPANPNATSYYAGDTTATRNDEDVLDEIPNVAPNEAVRYLREVALREFGTTNIDPLKYEFLEDIGQNRRSCILTITRPNGLSRSYRTKAEFIRKVEAKIAAASSAIQLGGVHFIKYGDTSKVAGRRGLVLAKLDVGVKKDEGDPKSENKNLNPEPEPEEEQDGSAVARVEACCIDWRAGSVIPKWVHLVDPKISNAHGYALKISLSSNIQRAYSVLTSEDYSKRSAAKDACARVAIEQNVLEFIKHGDGLEHPIIVPFAGAEAVPPPPPPTVTTLQAFNDTLPQPLPEPIGVKANGEINSVGWLNTMIQLAKGSRMTVTFTWYTDAKLGLHGCLLRLSRPGDVPTQSYLTDAIFAKRADAKLAVCLLACSQGVGDYIREIAAEVESRMTPEMRRRSTVEILPILGQALNRFKHGSRPQFSYECDLSTFGCTLSVDLSPDTETPIKKEWKVPIAYKSKADAKSAVACVAADDGVMDFIRSHGKIPIKQGVNEIEVELEEGETTEGAKKRKKKKGKKDGDMEDGDDAEAELLEKVRSSRKTEPVFETREEALAKGRFDAGPKKQSQRDFNGNGRGRGGAVRLGGRGRFGGNARGTSNFGRPSGVSSGFTARSGLRPPLPPFSVPPLPAHGYASPPAYGPGYHYGTEYGRRDRDYPFHARSDPGFAHARYGPGAASTNAAPLVHAPPPVPPRAVPGYGGYSDRARDYDYGPEHDYRSGPYAPQSQSSAGAIPPYDYDYTPPSAAPVLPPPPPPHVYRQTWTGAAEYHYTHDEYAGRPAHGVPRAAYEPEHYAPDYDRIPDHSVPPHPPSHASPAQSRSSSHSHGSVPPRHPRAHIERRGPAPTELQRTRASYNRPPAQSTQDGGTMYERVPPGEKPPPVGPSRRQPPVPVKSGPGGQAKIEQELNSVISRLEMEAEGAVVEEPGMTRRSEESSGRIGGKHPDNRETVRSFDRAASSAQETAVPSKRGRSDDREDQSNKRMRGRSKSMPRPSELGRSMDRIERPSSHNKSVVPEDTRTGREKSISPATESNEKKSLKRARDDSPAGEKWKGSDQKDKEKSYVAALFEHCDKEGMSRPELCHEEIQEGGELTFKVWIVMGKERLELPTTFKSLSMGRERVAKSVLGRVRGQTKKKKEM